MRLRDKISSVHTFAKVKFFGRRIPLAVRWQLTDRCSCRCQYCDIWNRGMKELSLQQIRSILDELAQMGTKRISFSGGEPMLRKDIAQILGYTKQKGISPSMNSSGYFVAEKINQLKELGLLKLSLDGTEEIHDRQRGRTGAYKQALGAARACKENGIKFTFCATLARNNLKDIKFLVKLAKRFDTLVAFQPLKDIYRGVKEMDFFYPEDKQWKEAVEELMTLKKRYPAHIRNSVLGLKHIKHWPRYKSLECWAGRIFCIIETNGDLYPCDRIDYPIAQLPSCVERGFKEAFNKLPEIRCSGCGFCGALELNFLLSYKFAVLKDIKRLGV